LSVFETYRWGGQWGGVRCCCAGKEKGNVRDNETKLRRSRGGENCWKGNDLLVKYGIIRTEPR